MATLELILEKLQVVLEKNEKLEQEVSHLRAEVKSLSEKLDQHLQSPSPPATTTTTTTATVARRTGCELTPSDKKAIKIKSEFNCSKRLTSYGLISGLPRVVVFRHADIGCMFMDIKDGTYTTPIGGKYEFGLRVNQIGPGVLRFFLLCKEMGWRHEILTTRIDKPKDEGREEAEENEEKEETEDKEKESEDKEEGEEKEKQTESEEEEDLMNASFDSYGDYHRYGDHIYRPETDSEDDEDDNAVKGTMVVDCKEFVDVKLQVVRLRGFARGIRCVFHGKLIDFS